MRRNSLEKTPEFLYPHGSHTDAYRSVSDTVANGGRWQGEQQLVAKSGRPVIVQTTIIPRFDKGGKHVDSVSILTDLTRAREEGAQLGRNAVIERLPDGVIVYDPEDFEIIYTQQKWAQTVGLVQRRKPGPQHVRHIQSVRP